MIKGIPDPQRIHSISCPKCASTFIATHLLKEPRFCVVCGTHLKKGDETEGTEGEAETVTLVAGHEPKEEAIKFSIGPYKILSSIGRGGMGEVFLAYDSTCGRRLALKKIRDDLSESNQVEGRFLREALITSQLTHPAIIPIYAIHSEPKNNFYTMPYVEGKTLKQILRQARADEKKGLPSRVETSIPALVRVFITICQAIAYAHDKHVLHRDLKPENIIIGKYGEVLILDWGLAKMWDKSGEEEKKGKIVGTLAYMPPERALGVPASPQSDIYALGVILYQILTLKMPFYRESLKTFKKNVAKEKVSEPSEVAPWREVPRILSQIVMRCLDPSLEKRYDSVLPLISDLNSYLEGRAEFFPIATLDPSKADDWEFQENVLIAEHMAITRNWDHSNWVNLMISKASFSENLRLEAHFILSEESHGIGFLLSVPEVTDRRHLLEGHYLWLATAKGENSHLLKSGVEVLACPEIVLEANKEIRLKIEKNDKHIYVWINGRLELSYVSHIPVVGTHVGLVLRDFAVEIKEIVIYEGSQNVLINCLAVPDAFLAHKDYQKALSEYRRIAYSFPGRMEGREAAFRAGIVILEQAMETTEIETAHRLFDEALVEFEKLHLTSGAPLEYLGKALVYHALADYEEEIKCFELAFRRYPQHPLLSILEEQMFFRLHESSKNDRKAAYAFLLLILQYLPQAAESFPVKRVLDSLDKHAEKIWFIEYPSHYRYNRSFWGILLAYSLGKGWVIEEILHSLDTNNPTDQILYQNGLWALKELGSSLGEPSDPEKCRFYRLRTLLDAKQTSEVLAELSEPKKLSLPLSCLRIEALLLSKKLKEAQEELLNFPLEWHTQESSLLPFLYGCWLYEMEDKDLAHIHFSGTLETAYPRSSTLGSLYIIDKLPADWEKRAFHWEKKELARQLALFHSLSGVI